jgi:hypothetical protein
MRTTISLDARLLQRLKQRATESGTTVSTVIETAVRLLLQTPPAQQQNRFELVTFGAGGQFTSKNVDKTAALFEEEDIVRFGRKR